MSGKSFYIIVALIVVILVSVPYLIAFSSGGQDSTFGGFLVNPLDGFSYLAKMRQGWQGSWRFTLPYTAHPGDGGFIFLYYLALGHLARIARLPLIVVFHISRIFNTILLAAASYYFWRSIFSLEWQRKFAYTVSLLGSGLGWTGILFGAVTSDFWVAEAFPFLSSYVNPHFPLGLACMVWLLLPGLKNRPLWITGVSFLLANIVPFGVVIVVLTLGGSTLIEGLRERKGIRSIYREYSREWRRVLLIAFSGGLVMGYQYWLVQKDPVLAGWHVQNVTATPPWWDVLLSFSPILILAILGVREAYQDAKGRMLLAWAGVSLILIFSPWSLQRRMMTGLYMPLVGLAGSGIAFLSRRFDFRQRTVLLLVGLLIFPTNIILIASGMQAALNRDEKIYLWKEETQAFQWIEDNTPQNALILAGPETGLLIPAETGRRVIYGHPYETVNAPRQVEIVQSFYSGDLQGLPSGEVDFIFQGPREEKMGTWLPGQGVVEVYANRLVSIYRVEGDQ